MRLGAQCRRLDLLQQFAEPLLRIDFSLEHLGIDEEPDQAFGLDPVAVGNRYAHADVRLAAVTVQQALERSQQQHEQAATFTQRQLPQLLAQCLR